MKTLLLVVLLLSTLVLEAQQYNTERNISYYADSIITKDSYIRSQCLLDVYYPVGTSNFATIVWFHGGGLTEGDKEIPTQLMNKGYAVIGVQYRFFQRPGDNPLHNPQRDGH